MAGFAQGKHAYGISDRSGFRYRLRDMRFEWNGSLVGKDEYEPKHPQLEPKRIKADTQTIRNARPDTATETTGFVVYTNSGDGIIGKLLESFEGTASVGTVTVTTS